MFERTFIRVYRLPEKLTDGYCFGDGKPIAFQNVDWMEAPLASLRGTISCPICAEPFKSDDICASDIEMGTCHAACLDGSPVVDLDTGAELPEGKVDTYPYSEVMDPPPSASQDLSLGWQPMETAPENGKHVILAVKSDAFVYAVQGAYMNRKWMNAANIDVEPLCWMPNVMVPAEYLPWTDEYKARAALTAAEGSTDG